ncbi:hypothetical protein J6P51_04490 [bacterium]|nr:hypothetical protein [bacterium]
MKRIKIYDNNKLIQNKEKIYLMKRSLKLTIGLLAIGSISAIAVGSVVSCSNNSNSNSTSSNTLQTTITGSTFTDISNN